MAGGKRGGQGGRGAKPGSHRKGASVGSGGQKRKGLKVAGRRLLPLNAKVTQRHGRLGVRMQLLLRLVVPVVLLRPVVLLLVVALRLPVERRAPVARPQLVDLPVLAVLQRPFVGGTTPAAGGWPTTTRCPTPNDSARSECARGCRWPQPGGRGIAREHPGECVVRGRRVSSSMSECVRPSSWRTSCAFRCSMRSGWSSTAMRRVRCIRGLVLQVPPFDYLHPDELLDRAFSSGVPLLVALDGATDPRNLGAVVRSVGVFGGHGVLVPERRSAGMTAAWKASAGAAARVPVARATNLTRALTAYAERGLLVVGLAGKGSLDLMDLEVCDRASCACCRLGGQGTFASSARALRHCRAHSDRVGDRVIERVGCRWRCAVRSRAPPRGSLVSRCWRGVRRRARRVRPGGTSVHSRRTTLSRRPSRRHGRPLPRGTIDAQAPHGRSQVRAGRVARVVSARVRVRTRPLASDAQQFLRRHRYLASPRSRGSCRGRSAVVAPGFLRQSSQSAVLVGAGDGRPLINPRLQLQT